MIRWPSSAADRPSDPAACLPGEAPQPPAGAYRRAVAGSLALLVGGIAAPARTDHGLGPRPVLGVELLVGSEVGIALLLLALLGAAVPHAAHPAAHAAHPGTHGRRRNPAGPTAARAGGAGGHGFGADAGLQRHPPRATATATATGTGAAATGAAGAVRRRRADARIVEPQIGHAPG